MIDPALWSVSEVERPGVWRVDALGHVFDEADLVIGRLQLNIPWDHARHRLRQLSANKIQQAIPIAFWPAQKPVDVDRATMPGSADFRLDDLTLEHCDRIEGTLSVFAKSSVPPTTGGIPDCSEYIVCVLGGAIEIRADPPITVGVFPFPLVPMPGARDRREAYCDPRVQPSAL